MELEGMERLAALGDRELRAALSYVLAQARSVTADELARSQSTHRNVARSRLERLADAGLVTRGYERRTGRAGPGAGRPAKTYAVAPQPTSTEFPQRRYEKLLGLAIESLPGTSREQLRALGLAFADELLRAVRGNPARSLTVGAERLCQAVRQLGFHAVVAVVGDRVAVIETATCPLRPLVREHSDAAEIDRGMWIGFAARALDGVEPATI